MDSALASHQQAAKRGPVPSLPGGDGALPRRAASAAPPSYLPDDAPRSLVRPRRRAASGRLSDPDAEFERQFEELASIWCTADEIAAVLGISARHLANKIRIRYQLSMDEAIKRFAARGRASLRRIQYEMAAEDRSVAMAIFLGKNNLDQADEPRKQISQSPVSVVILPAALDPAQWQQQMKQLEATRNERVAKAMEAAGLLLEDGEREALELPSESVLTRS